MPYLLKPLRPNVKDALTGADMPAEGVTREILIPPDHYAERTGDISIEDVRAVPPAVAEASSATERPPSTKAKK